MNDHEQIQDLLRRVKALENKRIYQDDIVSDGVKTRHVGEGVRFIQTGVAADRPTTPAEPPGSAMIYFETDTNKLYIWNPSTNLWVGFVRIPATIPDYTVTNLTIDRSYDADAAVVAETNDVLGTLISDLITAGILQ